jgi:hypothetical protein
MMTFTIFSKSRILAILSNAGRIYFQSSFFWILGLSTLLCFTTKVNAQKTIVKTCTIANTTFCDGSESGHGPWLDLLLSGVILDRFYSYSNTKFTEYSDGTALFQGQITNLTDLGVKFDVIINLKDKSVWGTPHFINEDPFVCTRSAQPDWRYYTLVSGTFKGSVGTKMAGAVMTVQPFPFTNLQIGTGAAFTSTTTTQISCWLDLQVISQPTNGLSLFNNGNGTDIYANVVDCELITTVKTKVYFEGLLNGSTMRTDLLTKNLLPKQQPFNTSPWNYAGSESVINFPANVSDWVLVVARHSDGMILAKKAAFIRNDGVLLNIDGTEGIAMANLMGDVFISIHHKSHIAVMSNTAITSNVLYDFTSSQSQAKGSLQQKLLGTSWSVYSGDFDQNGLNNNLDFNLWKQKGAAVNQYLNVDGDGNGIVNNLDINLWMRNRSKVGISETQSF